MAATNEERIKVVILVPLIITLFSLLGSSVFGIFRIQQVNIDENVRSHIASVDQLFKGMLNQEAKLMGNIIDFSAKDKKLQTAFLKKDRAELHRNAMPLFNDIRAKYQITHFYFLTSDKTCFLRVHNPSRHSDVIQRITTDQAVHKKDQAHGIELGPFGTFTLRTVHPWRVSGEIVGYIELGRELGDITPELKKNIGTELLFAINKSTLNRDKWEEGLQMTNRSGDWDLFPRHVISDRTLADVPIKLNEYLRQSHDSDEAFLFKVSEGKRYYRGGFTPLLDAGNRNIGKIIVLKDFTKEEKALQKLTVLLVVICLIFGGILSGSFYLYIDHIQDRLLIARNKLKAEIAERIQTEKRKEQLISNFEEALDTVNTLSGLLPICAYCKNIRDDKGYWNRIETYIQNHSDAEFSHGMCPDCFKKHHPDLQDDVDI